MTILKKITGEATFYLAAAMSTNTQKLDNKISIITAESFKDHSVSQWNLVEKCDIPPPTAPKTPEPMITKFGAGITTWTTRIPHCKKIITIPFCVPCVRNKCVRGFRSPPPPCGACYNEYKVTRLFNRPNYILRVMSFGVTTLAARVNTDR